jgi:hypothetical protein
MESTKEKPMSALISIVILAAAAAAAVYTGIEVARDGYHRIPTHRA